MVIEQADTTDAHLLASIVSESNKDVARLFGIDIHNAPKHPSFCKPEWILDELARGQKFLIYRDHGIAKGCVAIELPDENTAYLNRLAVLSQYRHNGIGSLLVKHILEVAKDKGVDIVSIGIIAQHNLLKTWYQKLGFECGTIKKFDHLPFDVLYMQYALTKC